MKFPQLRFPIAQRMPIDRYGSRAFLSPLTKRGYSLANRRDGRGGGCLPTGTIRNSINVRIGDFAPVFWIAARIKRLTLLDHVASWRSPEGGRAYWRTNERAESLLAGPRRRERDRNGAREREKKPSREKRERQTGEKEKEASAARPGKRERGAKRGEKGQGEDGQEDEGGPPSTDEGRRWELKGETDDAAEVRRFSP